MEWINVNDKLPNYFQIVEVKDSKGSIQKAHYSSSYLSQLNKDYWCIYGTMKHSSVTHWRETKLPKP